MTTAFSIECATRLWSIPGYNSFDLFDCASYASHFLTDADVQFIQIGYIIYNVNASTVTHISPQAFAYFMQ